MPIWRPVPRWYFTCWGFSFYGPVLQWDLFKVIQFILLIVFFLFLYLIVLLYNIWCWKRDPWFLWSQVQWISLKNRLFWCYCLLHLLGLVQCGTYKVLVLSVESGGVGSCFPIASPAQSSTWFQKWFYIRFHYWDFSRHLMWFKGTQKCVTLLLYNYYSTLQ